MIYPSYEILIGNFRNHAAHVLRHSRDANVNAFPVEPDARDWKLRLGGRRGRGEAREGYCRVMMEDISSEQKPSSTVPQTRGTNDLRSHEGMGGSCTRTRTVE